MKQFHVTERETLIRINLVEAESEEAFHNGEYKFVEMVDEDCVNSDFLGIEEV